MMIIHTICFYLLLTLNTSATIEVGNTNLKELLQQVPEIPAIPTKDGYYIFVPSKACNCESQSKKSQPQQILSQSNEIPANTHTKLNKNSNTVQNEVKRFSIPQMRGVNRAGLEYNCVKGFGIFDGPSDEASIEAIKKWNVNIIRIPLNEDCWLGIDGINAAFNGENYRSAVINYVKLLRKHGLTVILDLHWTNGEYSGPGKVECTEKIAKCQKPMPDSENSPRFWQSVAKQFKDDINIIYDLFNNPFPDKAIQDKTAAWKCWKNGGDACPGFKYKVAGMQDLVNAVRSIGANNPLMLGGIRSANDLSKWQEYIPHDPQGKIIASWHSFKDDLCNNEKCWNAEIAPITKNHSIIVGEIGESGCAHTYIDKLMDWLDNKQISYLGWTWNTWDCSSGPSLIKDYNGTPTDFGKGLYDRLNGKRNNVPQPSAGSNSGGSKTAVDNSKQGPGSTTSSGNNSGGKQLRGVNRSGAEYSCVKNFGIFEGPVDDNAIKRMKSWNINVVRVPLNEDCWLGINGHNTAYSGENYKKAVIDYVNLLRKNDLKVVLDLHWTDGIYGGPGQGECYDKTAKCQKPMPDKENAPKFWQSVAKQFKDDNAVIFDLFNEPFPDMVINDKSAAWKCWREGGSACPGFKYEVAGMQDLVTAVREAGAKNQVMVGGITWANDLSQWMQYVPKDTANNIAASWHSYNFNACNNKNCWESQVAPVAAKYPVIAGEIGEHGCTHTYIDGLMDWLDQNKISYIGWTWNTWDCSSGPSLITDYNGTPTEFGKGLKDHLSRNFDSSETPLPNIGTKPVQSGSESSDSTSTGSSGKKCLTKQLRGVNRSGAEYSCVKNLGIFEGPVDDNAIKSMKKWNINVVRIPLNEDCWLGINGHTAAYIGENYRNAVINYVSLLRKYELSVILDLHWSGGLYNGAGRGECYDKTAKCQKPMPDAENAPKFWKAIAKQFSGDDNIIFDLYNEPFPDMVYWEKSAVWKCWRDGGSSCPNFPFAAAGMQDLVNAVREVGATNPVMVGGINWSSDLTQWKQYVPKDPLNKIIASWHAYALNPCNNTKCWETMISPIAKEYPVIVGEMGETDCTHDYIDQLMDWLDSKQISYVGWTWNTWDCRAGPALITNYDGTPTDFGKGLMDHLTTSDTSKKLNKNDNNKNTNTVVNNPEKQTTKQLRGVNRSGTEYSCVKNLGIFEGPIDDNAVKTMKKWNINAVRVPLNEDCWLGINSHTAAYIGDKYQSAVISYVNLLRKNDLNVILDLHWTDGIYGGPGQGDCYDQTAKCQKPMPDKENAPKFWQSVAKQFKNDNGIIFDLFNEPFPDMVINDKSAAWKCWRDGGSACPGFKYEVAGMQDLVNAVRETGAKNQVMVGGITWANDLSQWMEYVPKDTANNIAASWHSYNFNACNNKNCWESQVAPVAAKYPVIAGEIGEHGCTHTYIDGLMDWLDEKKISYFGWTWNTWDCSSGPSLITDYNGTPTEFGIGLQKHLQK